MDDNQTKGEENGKLEPMISDYLSHTLSHISEHSFVRNKSNNYEVDDSEHALEASLHQQQTDNSRRPSRIPESHDLPRLTVAELSKKFPTITVPRLYCFTSVLSPVGAEANKILRDMEPMVPKKRTKRETLVKKMRRSYHLSHSNEATTQRIMKKFNDNELTVDLNESDVARVMSMEYLPWRVDSTRESVTDRDEEDVKWLEPTPRSSHSDETYSNHGIAWLTFPLLPHTGNFNNSQPFHSADHNGNNCLLPAVSSTQRPSCSSSSGKDDSVRTSMPVKLPRLIHTSDHAASTVRERVSESSMWTNYA